MLRWLKKHFIPHEGNDHQPHFLRGDNIRFLVFIVFVIEIGVLLAPSIPILSPVNNRFTAAVLPSVLDDLTNQNRQEQHLTVLAVNPILNKVAELKAEDMATKGYFAHTSPEGKAPWYWFKQAGYSYEYAGENLAVDFTDSEDVTLAWMNSPTHRANIVKDAYTEVGTGIATGVYQGNPTVFVAQVYGKPATLAMANVSAPKPVVVPTKVPTAEVAVATQTPVVVAPIVDTKPAQMYVKTNIFERFATSPRSAANVALAFIGGLVFLALLLKLFIRMDKRHPLLITNGLVVLALVFGVYVANNAIAKSKAAVTTSFVSFQGEQFDQGR